MRIDSGPDDPLGVVELPLEDGEVFEKLEEDGFQPAIADQGECRVQRVDRVVRLDVLGEEHDPELWVGLSEPACGARAVVGVVG
jgi:hypothetical protein